MDNKPKIVLSVDNGLSATKAVWLDPDGFSHLMEMGPEIKNLRESDLVDSGLSKGQPINDAWVTITDSGSSRDTTTVALGLKAQQLQGRPPFKETKYGPAVYKIAAVVGAIAQELGVTSLSLYLGTLLPYIEYRDKQRFEVLLKESLKNFSFRGSQIKCELLDLYIAPEGAGIGESYASTFEHEFNTQNTLILILGHRDVSRLPYRRGTFLEQPGAQLGFSLFVEDVCKTCALNLDEARLTLATAYIYRSKWEEDLIKRLASMAVRDKKEIAHKVDEIARAIDQAKYRYLTSLMEHLTDIDSFIQETDRVIVSGGPTSYWLEDLEEYFKDYPNLANKPLVYEESYERISELLGPQDDALYPRLGDVVGLFDRLVYDAELDAKPYKPQRASATVTATPPAAQVEEESTVSNGHAKPPELPPLGEKTSRSKRAK